MRVNLSPIQPFSQGHGAKRARANSRLHQLPKFSGKTIQQTPFDRDFEKLFEELTQENPDFNTAGVKAHLRQFNLENRQVKMGIEGPPLIPFPPFMQRLLLGVINYLENVGWARDKQPLFTGDVALKNHIISENKVRGLIYLDDQAIGANILTPLREKLLRNPKFMEHLDIEKLAKDWHKVEVESGKVSWFSRPNINKKIGHTLDNYIETALVNIGEDFIDMLSTDEMQQEPRLYLEKDSEGIVMGQWEGQSKKFNVLKEMTRSVEDVSGFGEESLPALLPLGVHQVSLSKKVSNMFAKTVLDMLLSGELPHIITHKRVSSLSNDNKVVLEDVPAVMGEIHQSFKSFS